MSVHFKNLKFFDKLNYLRVRVGMPKFARETKFEGLLESPPPSSPSVLSLGKNFNLKKTQIYLCWYDLNQLNL